MTAFLRGREHLFQGPAEPGRQPYDSEVRRQTREGDDLPHRARQTKLRAKQTAKKLTNEEIAALVDAARSVIRRNIQARG